MEILWEYVKVFAVGGALCVIGQLLIDRTNLTPGRILVSFVTAGVILSAIGLYKPVADFAGAGASVPLTGFGSRRLHGRRDAHGGRHCRRCHLRLPLRPLSQAQGKNVTMTGMA